MTDAERELQKRLVQLSTQLSGRRQERRDEAAALGRLYSTRAREARGNVIPLGRHVPPTPPAA